MWVSWFVPKRISVGKCSFDVLRRGKLTQFYTQFQVMIAMPFNFDVLTNTRTKEAVLEK
jgi:hypothetical protein